jgi:hypothetical protein
MSSRTAAWLAWSIWTLSLPLVAVSGVLGFLSVSTRTWDASISLFLFPLMSLMFLTVGAVVASRRPENPIGWIFCAAGVLLSVAVSASAYLTYALYASRDALPGVEYAAWLAGWIPFPTLFLAATMLFLLFPNGSFLTREWSFVAWVALIGSVLAALGEALGREEAAAPDYGGSIANPVAIRGEVGDFLLTLGGFGLVLLVLSCLASITSLIARWVRASGQERQQLKWFAYAAAVMISGFLLAFTTGGYRSLEVLWDIGTLVGILGFAFLPVATAIAILKYRLYDIDRIINRTLVYGALTAILGAHYFGSIVWMQWVFVELTGQRSTLAVVASTLLIAALFNPFQRWVQAFVDRRFYRRKYDAAKTLEAFSAKLRDETDLDALNEDLVGVVRETMQPAHVSLWLRPDTASKKDEAPG